MSEKHHTLTLDGYGSLFLVSYENIRALRGRGARLGGIVVDEGAHFNLRYAWRSVIRPTLMDCQGWAMIDSTTNAGPDGGIDANGQRSIPSFFNVLCQQIMGGQRSSDWAHWHSDARQNPIISPSEFESLVAEYADGGESALQEEVYAELLTGGVGLAFPEWRETIHIRAEEPTEYDKCAAGMDWGHGTPGWFGLVYTRPGNRLLLRDELYFKRTRAKKIGYQIGKMCWKAVVQPEFISLDLACFNVTGTGATIAEKIREGLEIAYERLNATLKRPEDWKPTPALVPGPKGPDAVRTQKTLLHEVLGWEMDEDGVLVEPPILTVHPDCKDFCRTVAGLPLDRLDPNKFDTKGEDHAVQGFAYYLGLRAPEFQAPAVDPEVAAARRKLDTASRHEAEQGDDLMDKLAIRWNQGRR